MNALSSAASMNLFRASFSSASSSADHRGSVSTRLAPISTATPSSSTTGAPANRILSSFNPTQTLYIPSHGLLIPTPSCGHPILDLTPLLRHRKTAGDASADERAFRADVASILANRRHDIDAPGVGYGLETAVMLRKHSLSAPGIGEVARWRVPWALWKDSRVVVVNSHGAEVRIDVWTHDFDPRSQEFEFGCARYRWRWVAHREMVLEKTAPGCGRYTVAVFYREKAATAGALLLDERGIEMALCVATLEVALKRERQRWSVCGGTV